MTTLRVYTEYSILKGECRITDIIDRAEELSIKALAKTDMGNLFGAVEFWEYAKKKNINPIIGCEVSTYIRGEKVTLLVLAKNNEGISSLNILSSYMMTEGNVPQNVFSKNSGGIIGIVIDTWEIFKKGTENASAIILDLKKCFTDFYAGLERRLGEGEEKTKTLYDFCRSLGVGCVITNPVYITKEENEETKTLLDFIREGEKRESEKHVFLQGEEETKKLFAHIPEVFENTEKIGMECSVSFDTNTLHLPSFPTDDSTRLLEEKAFWGLENHQKSKDEQYIKRLRKELSVIEKMGFSDYFLITEDFVSFAKEKDIPVGPGRGSGVGSLVAYCLGITSVDPVENGLMFERFLNEERVSMPDFDIDFGDERRHEVVEYVRQKYGKKRVGGIVNFSRFAFRQSIRDVAKYLNWDAASFIKKIPTRIGITVDEAISESKELKKEIEFNKTAEKAVKLCRLLEGRPRTFSSHPSGIIITEKPLVSHVPLMKSGDETLCQYTMDICAKLGLLKIDFLGIKFLTVIHKTKKLIMEKSGEKEGYPVTDEFPPHNDKVFAMLSKGESDGVFQLESQGMKELLSKIKPQNIDDITATLSLYRPGPKVYIDDYIKGKKDEKNIIYPVEIGKEALRSTYGCPIYQEQIMQLCTDAAGFTLGHADMVRRAMAKKDKNKMETERDAFIKGCMKNNIDEKKASSLFEKISGFAKYAFNKSHAAAYALLAYETAYLKCLYPCEYFSARLDSIKESFDKISDYATELKKIGLSLLPPHINKSEVNFSPCEEGVRYSFSAIKGISASTAERIVNERKKGEYKSTDDFLWRMGGDIGQISAVALARSGAFDCFGETRSTTSNLFTDNLSQFSAPKVSEYQLSFSFEETAPSYKRRTESEYDETTLVTYEKEYTGVDFSSCKKTKKTKTDKKQYALYIRLTADNRDNLPSVFSKLSEKGNCIIRIYDPETETVKSLTDVFLDLKLDSVDIFSEIMGKHNVKLKELERNNE